jgi:hypothetical protein
MYLPTVALLSAIPSLSSSPWIRGAVLAQKRIWRWNPRRLIVPNIHFWAAQYIGDVCDWCEN